MSMLRRILPFFLVAVFLMGGAVVVTKMVRPGRTGDVLGAATVADEAFWKTGQPVIAPSGALHFVESAGTIRAAGPQMGVVSAARSADGGAFAVAETAGTTTAVRLFELQDGAASERVLLASSGTVTQLRFSPTGKHLAYLASRQEGGSDLMMTDMRGVVRRAASSVRAFAWAAAPLALVAAQKDGTLSFHSVNADGTFSAPVTIGAAAGAPVVEGSDILFLRREDDGAQLAAFHLVSQETENVAALELPRDAFAGMTPSPDGQQLLVSWPGGSGQQNQMLALVRPAAKTVQPLDTSAIAAAWMDGGKLLLQRAEGGGETLWTFSIATGALTKIPTDGSFRLAP